MGNPNLDIVLWARGMSTFVAIEYASSMRLPKQLKFMVLDSPFTSVEDIIESAAASINTTGIAIPGMFVRFALGTVRKHVIDKLKYDPYRIKPIHLASLVRTPCFVVSADEDDFIPSSMGKQFVDRLSCDKWHRIFPGDQFGARDACLVLSPVDKVARYVKVAEGCSGLPSQISEREDEESVDVAHDAPSEGIAAEHGDLDTSELAAISNAPDWVSDDAVKQCNVCAIKFSLLTRRHHCRNCGNIVCGRCSMQRVLLLHVDCHTTVRVCDACMTLA